MNRTKNYFTKRIKSLIDIFEAEVAKKLRTRGIYRVADLQDMCEKEPKRLLEIPELGPIRVKEICNKVGIDKSINELHRIYSKTEKKTFC